MYLRASVVIPTYRRPHLLMQCLNHLVRQVFPSDQFEIIVADDAADELTERMVRRFQDEMLQHCVRYVPVRGQHGPAAARNVGWKMARGPIIAFTDDDCLPAANWLSAGVDRLEAGADAAWGALVMPLPRLPTDYELNASKLATAVFVTANCFCNRELLNAIGGFDPRFTAAWREDSDLYFSLLDHGANIVHAKDAVVIHPIRQAGWGVSIWQQKKSIFDSLLFRKHPQKYRRTIPVFPKMYYLASGAFIAGLTCFAMGLPALAITLLVAWLGLVAYFCVKRLKGTAHSFSHICEMMVTSAAIPFVAVFWRLYGNVKFRVGLY